MKRTVIIIFSAITIFLVVNFLFETFGVRNSYLLGLAGALTPCTIILIPIFLYRFGVWGDSKLLIKEIIFTLIGFLVSFTIIGYFFEVLSTSFIFDAVKMLMAIGMMILAVLQFNHKLNFDFLSKVSNPFILGLLLPMALSFSSCVLPFFTVNLVTAAEAGIGYVALSSIAFGIGLILPALLVGIFGGNFYSFIKKSQNVTRFIDYIGGFIILASGLYIITRVERLETINIMIVVIILLAYLIFLSYKLFSIHSNRTYQNYYIFSLILFVFILSILRVIYLANSFITTTKHLYSCQYDEIICPSCTEAAVIFAIFAGTITLIYLILSKNISLPKIRVKL